MLTTERLGAVVAIKFSVSKFVFSWVVNQFPSLANWPIGSRLQYIFVFFSLAKAVIFFTKSIICKKTKIEKVKLRKKLICTFRIIQIIFQKNS